jgi:hypothetical protein
MKTMRHVGLRLDSEEERTKFLDIGVEFTSSTKMPGGGIVANIDLAEDDPRWRSIELLLGGRRTLECVTSTFSPADLDTAKFLRILAKSGGYPQPEDNKEYLSATYDLSEYCARCGVGMKQNRPFRLKGPPALRDNSVLQLNWIFDECFVTHATWEAVFKPLGIEKRPAVVHRSGVEIGSAFQLDIPQVCDLKLEGANHAECLYCGRKKYSPVFRGFLPEPVAPKSSIFKSSQWFGSGALAFNLVIVSADLYRRVKEVGLKGAKFWACANEFGDEYSASAIAPAATLRAAPTPEVHTSPRANRTGTMDRRTVASLIDNLESEVNNGGFDQFFYNSAGDNTAETIHALEEIGAATMADIVRRAAAKFPGNMPPKDRFARQEILLQISPDGEAFDELDGEFYGYPDDLAELLAKYDSQ